VKKKITFFWVVIILSLLNSASCLLAGTAVIMDSTHHNGALTATSTGFWSSTANANPSGWTLVTPDFYTTAVGWVQAGSTAQAVNNTGEIVQAGRIFTVSTDLGGGNGTDATVCVYATQNSDGTGTKVELASVHRVGQATDGYNLFNVVGSPGSPAPASTAGYYVQVSIGGPYVDHYISGYYDNIVVTTDYNGVDPAFNGIDFWANDRVHLPDYNASSNIILNPSFEAGFRYWGYLCYAQSMIPLQYTNFHDIDPNVAHSGSQSLRLKAISLRDPLGVGCFPIPVNPGTTYVLSFYAKGSLASNLKLNLWARGRNTYFLPGTLVPFNVTNEWQRYSISFSQAERFISLYFDAQSTSSSIEGNVWLDDVQLEVGTTPTNYTQAPVSAQLTSAARGNFLEFGQQPDFNMVVKTNPNTSGTFSLSVEDFFFNNVFSENYQFTTDSAGKSIIPLDKLSNAIYANGLRGVYIVTGVFNVNGITRPYTDYFRFSVMDFLSNTHKNKNMFNLTYVYSLQSGGAEMDRFLTRERALGFGSMTYDFGKFANDFSYVWDSERTQKIIDYGFAPMGRPVLKLHDGVNGEISEANGLYKMINVKTRTSPSDMTLADFASICTIKAQKRSFNPIWWFTGESNPGCEPLESTPDAFAKFLIATNQGCKAGNPQAKVLIEGGPWKLDAESTGWVERYIQDTKRINPSVQFDGAAAHHYRNFPETPDLDTDIAYFLAMLDRNGCSNWPFYINEGGNYCPFDIPEESISPYVVQSGNSWYMGPVSYHSGRSERIVPAFSARNWIIGLKYQNRVACMEDFMTPSRYTDVDFTSRFYEKVPNTLGRILGNASFVNDIVFAPYCKGYLFRDDLTNVPIAVIWGYKEAVDRWQEDAPKYTFDFSNMNVKFIDLMENEVQYPTDCDGRTIIPLSPFPIFIKGQPGTESQLTDAIHNYSNGLGTPYAVMGASLHNGSLSASSYGFWNTTPAAIPEGWVQTHSSLYTTASMFVQSSGGGIATNNTGEVVSANHKYTVSARLGGPTGTTATVKVYATQNVDGTGNKVELVQVSRAGNSSDVYSLFVVANTGTSVSSSLAGYFVQVVLATDGYYDDIVVYSQPDETLLPACCGDADHPYPVGDLNFDCYVNWYDLWTFGEQWLDVCAGPNWCMGADISHDSNVKLNDFATFAGHWLDCTDPQMPCGYNP